MQTLTEDLKRELADSHEEFKLLLKSHATRAEAG